jgi:hypothetical protein
MEDGAALEDHSVNIDVRSDRVLVVEGPFDYGFMSTLLRRNNRRRVEILPVEGKSQFRRRALTRLVSDDRRQLRWIGLARDADQDPRAALQSLQETMREYCRLRPDSGFGENREAWVRTAHGAHITSTRFVFPSMEEPGDIESWIWSALAVTPIAACVDDYVRCLIDSGYVPVRESKTRVYSYLAALAHPDDPLHAAARGERIPMDGDQFLKFVAQIPADDETL